MLDNEVHRDQMQQGINTFCRCIEKLTGAHLGIHTLDYTLKSEENLDNFCYFCNNQCNEFHKACKCDDQRHLTEATKNGAVTIYRCHMGLTEVIIPITDENSTLGVAFLGQLYVVPDEMDSFDSIFQYLHHMCPDCFSEKQRGKLQYLYQKIPRMTKETLDNWITMVYLAARGQYVSHWLNHAIILPETRFRRYMELLDIDRTPLAEISAKKAAQQMNISYSQLNRLSVKILGMPFKQYILKVKIETAANLLSTQETMSVREVAAAVGIDDPHYFSRLFMERMGCRCSEYRKKNRQ